MPRHFVAVVLLPTLRAGVRLGPGARGNRVGSRVALFGPAFVASVAYLDPGNFATNFVAGSRFRYRLVWVVVLANLMAMPVQFMSAKIGIVTGRSIAELCREHTRPWLRYSLWVQAEIIAMATDLAEFVGAAIGLNLLFGVAALPAGLITAIAAFAVLGFQQHGARAFERAVVFLLLIITAGFGYQLAVGGVDADGIAAGLRPSLSGAPSLYLATAIIGATIMPHVIYLHSALTARRVNLTNDADRRSVLRFERADVLVALGLAGLINLSMLAVAAHVLPGLGGADLSLVQIHHGLGAALGAGAALAFAVALLASGVSSSSVGTFAGQEVMSGLLRRRVPLVVRRLLTMAPALVVLALGLDPTRALTLSQVALSFGLPFALVPLLLITSSRTVMGSFRNTWWTVVLLTAITTTVIGFNVLLIAAQFA